jgi:hypothetical protein
MKVDKNRILFSGDSSWSNIPLRLEIAARLLAGAVNSDFGVSQGDIREALQAADLLIEEHNKTCDKKEY